jgi:hypothetical protein
MGELSAIIGMLSAMDWNDCPQSQESAPGSSISPYFGPHCGAGCEIREKNAAVMLCRILHGERRLTFTSETNFQVIYVMGWLKFSLPPPAFQA